MRLIWGTILSLTVLHAGPSARPILDSALSLQVEYAADIAFDLIERNLIEDRTLRRETLERLYLLAPTAQRRLPVLDAGEALADTSDTVSGRTAAAAGLGLDQQSIQLRAVLLMLPMESRRARQMFDDIPAPPLDPAPCTAALVPDHARYYTTLERLFREGFTAAERRKADNIQFLRVHLSAVRSISQLLPVIQLLIRLPLSLDDRKELTTTVLQQLPGLSGGDREFTFAERRLGAEVQKLALVLPAADGSRKALAAAYRAFLLARLSTRRCADSRTPGDAAVIARFNTQLLPFLDDEASCIREDDLRPEFTLDRAKVEPLPFPDFRGTLSTLIRLRNAEDTDWSAPEAKQAVSAMLDQVHAIGEREKTAPCAICYFFVHGNLDSLLIALLPKDRAGEVIDDYIHLLANSPLQSEAPTEWLSQLRLLLAAIRKIAPEQQGDLDQLKQKGKVLSMLPSASREAVLDNLRRSNNPVLNVYTLQEQQFPKPFQLPRAR